MYTGRRGHLNKYDFEWRVLELLNKSRHTSETMRIFLEELAAESRATAASVWLLDEEDHISLYGVDEKAVQTLGCPYKPIKDGWDIPIDHTQQATDLILNHPEIFNDYEIIKGRMDDVFLAVTGRNLPGGKNG